MVKNHHETASMVLNSHIQSFPAVSRACIHVTSALRGENGQKEKRTVFMLLLGRTASVSIATSVK